MPSAIGSGVCGGSRGGKCHGDRGTGRGGPPDGDGSLTLESVVLKGGVEEPASAGWTTASPRSRQYRCSGTRTIPSPSVVSATDPVMVSIRRALPPSSGRTSSSRVTYSRPMSPISLRRRAWLPAGMLLALARRVGVRCDGKDSVPDVICDGASFQPRHGGCRAEAVIRGQAKPAATPDRDRCAEARPADRQLVSQSGRRGADHPAGHRSARWPAASCSSSPSRPSIWHSTSAKPRRTCWAVSRRRKTPAPRPGARQRSAPTMAAQLRRSAANMASQEAALKSEMAAVDAQLRKTRGVKVRTTPSRGSAQASMPPAARATDRVQYRPAASLPGERHRRAGQAAQGAARAARGARTIDSGARHRRGAGRRRRGDRRGGQLIVRPRGGSHLDIEARRNQLPTAIRRYRDPHRPMGHAAWLPGTARRCHQEHHWPRDRADRRALAAPRYRASAPRRDSPRLLPAAQRSLPRSGGR